MSNCYLQDYGKPYLKLGAHAAQRTRERYLVRDSVGDRDIEDLECDLGITVSTVRRADLNRTGRTYLDVNSERHICCRAPNETAVLREVEDDRAVRVRCSVVSDRDWEREVRLLELLQLDLALVPGPDLRVVDRVEHDCVEVGDVDREVVRVVDAV